MKEVNKFRIGDNVKLVKSDSRYSSKIGDIGVILSTCGYSGSSTLRVMTKGSAKDWHKSYTKLVTNKGENMSRRTFRLIKDSIEIKAGMLVQEACDEGNQEYRTLNMEKFMRFSDYKKYFSSPSNSFSRDTVEQSPEWFEEVFPATEQWMTKEEKDNFARFLKGEKNETPKEGISSTRLTGTYGFLYTMAVGDKKTVANKDVNKTIAAANHAKKTTGRTFRQQRVNGTSTYIIRVS